MKGKNIAEAFYLVEGLDRFLRVFAGWAIPTRILGTGTIREALFQEEYGRYGVKKNRIISMSRKTMNNGCGFGFYVPVPKGLKKVS